MNFLLTGATGYIGYNICKKLLQNGHNVTILVRQSSNYKKLKELKFDNLSIYVHLDVFTLKQILINNDINVVIHMAAKVINNHKSRDITDLVLSNILLGTELLEAMKVTGVKNFINTSTFWQHFKDENYNPVNLYAATKEGFEKIIEYYSNSGFINCINLELFDIYGPNDEREKIINIIVNAKDNTEIAMTEGKQDIDLIYIDDVVDAYLCAIKLLANNKSSGIYRKFMVGSGKPLILRQVINELVSKLNSNVSIKWGEKPYKSREVMRISYNNDKIPNWNPKVDLNEGFTRVIRNIKR
nr:NAD(P)-dependent oxidoreductase [uncultured Carboxylicivirga sp.]